MSKDMYKQLEKAYTKLRNTPDWNGVKVSKKRRKQIDKENYELNHPYGF